MAGAGPVQEQAPDVWSAQRRFKTGVQRLTTYHRSTQQTPVQRGLPQSDPGLCERLLQQHDHELRLQEIEARERELERQAQVLQEHQLHQVLVIATAPAMVTAPATAIILTRATPVEEV